MSDKVDNPEGRFYHDAAHNVDVTYEMDFFFAEDDA